MGKEQEYLDIEKVYPDNRTPEQKAKDREFRKRLAYSEKLDKELNKAEMDFHLTASEEELIKEYAPHPVPQWVIDLRAEQAKKK